MVCTAALFRNVSPLVMIAASWAKTAAQINRSCISGTSLTFSRLSKSACPNSKKTNYQLLLIPSRRLEVD